MASRKQLVQTDYIVVSALSAPLTGYVGVCAKSDGLYIRQFGTAEEKVVTGTPWAGMGYVTGTPWTGLGYLTATTVFTTVVSGFVTGANSTVLNTDTIEVAFEKLQGQINARVSGSAAALTKTDDTNVTLTLGGTPATALLQAASITVGWTGTLADGRIASAATWNAKQTGHASLTSLAALSYVSSSFVKMTAAGTFALDTATYVTGTPWTGMGYLTAITKAQVEAVLTGAISTHTHSYQGLNTDLTAIAGLIAASGFLKKVSSGTWALDANTYLTAEADTLDSVLTRNAVSALIPIVGSLSIKGAAPMFKIIDTDHTNPFTTLDNDVNCAGAISPYSGTTGGLIASGFSSLASVPGLGFRGYIGSATPTGPAIMFRAGKLSGTTGADMANSEVAVRFQSHSLVTYLEILGSGAVQLQDNNMLQWGGFNALIYGSNASKFIKISTNNQDRLMVTTLGNVLIGTVTDDTVNKLQVNGVITATGGNSTQWNAASTCAGYAAGSVAPVLSTDTVIVALSKLQTGLPVYARVASTQTTTLQTAVAITGLSVNVAIGTFEIEVGLFVGTSADTAGTGYDVSLSSGTGTWAGGLFGTSTVTGCKSERLQAGTLTPGFLVSASGYGYVLIRAIVVMTVAGAVAVRHGKTTSGTSSVFANSFLKVTRIV